MYLSDRRGIYTSLNMRVQHVRPERILLKILLILCPKAIIFLCKSQGLLQETAVCRLPLSGSTTCRYHGPEPSHSVFNVNVSVVKLLSEGCRQSSTRGCGRTGCDNSPVNALSSGQNPLVADEAASTLELRVQEYGGLPGPVSRPDVLPLHVRQRSRPTDCR